MTTNLFALLTSLSFGARNIEWLDRGLVAVSRIVKPFLLRYGSLDSTAPLAEGVVLGEIYDVRNLSGSILTRCRATVAGIVLDHAVESGLHLLVPGRR